MNNSIRLAAWALGLAWVSRGVAATAVPCLTEPIGDVQMTAPVPGTVAAIHQGEGQFVAAGTVVLELESRAEQLDLERRTVHVETLKTELDRSETLLKSTSSISKEEVEKKRGEFKVAALEMELARDALVKRKIIAPLAGVVTLVPIQVGEYCQPPKVLVRIVDARQFYAIANIDPASANSLALGRGIQLELGEGAKAERLEGKIIFISPVVDPASGLLRIKALFNNTEGKVRPGVAGRLQLP